MYSFLLRPRWLRMIAAAVVVAVGCVLLGMWQFDRRSERNERNELIRRQLAASPAPIGEVARAGRDLPPSEQWRPVEVKGRYDERRQLLVRNRVLDGAAGYHVVTPLVTADGPALLINRGWVRPGPTARALPDVPAPPDGVVTVVARLRPSEPSDGGPPAPAGQVRRIDVNAIA